MKLRYRGEYPGSPGGGIAPWEPGEVRDVEDATAADLLAGGWFERVRATAPTAPPAAVPADETDTPRPRPVRGTSTPREAR